jgi:hypothetical protein
MEDEEMTRILIWWHRRWAAWHDAEKHNGAWNYHETWRDWHLAQIERHETK